MIFPQVLQPAILQRRYKRFLADVELPDGTSITLHCPNTGSMRNCQTPNSRVWYTNSANKLRKYPCTWQIVENASGQIVGVNTGLANQLVVEAIQNGRIRELQGYEKLETEVSYGEQGSRIDILLRNTVRNPSASDKCYVEIKNVSLAADRRLALFPDAVTVRGHKHLQELMLMRAQGHRAVLLFCVQISAVEAVAPADDIDPEYGRLLRLAAASGVEVLAYRADFDLAKSTISLNTGITVELH